METPPARGRDAALLQRQLLSPNGEQLHSRRVSRSLQLEDSFFTPRSSPQGFTASHTRFDPPQNSHAQNSSGTSYLDSKGDQSLKANPNILSAGASTSKMHFNDRFPHSPGKQPATGPSGSHQLASIPTALRPTHRSPPASPTQSPARALGSRRRCAKCDGDISGHFVRALGTAYHIECFTCKDCGEQCASKFFPIDSQPLCEHCYFKRQNLLCYRCGNSLRGRYITALDRKYHVEHFTCSLCTTVFGQNDSYFEYNGDVYCRAHYSSLFAFHCEGCKSPILKQFVETYRGGKKQQWHPECYMIFKFWSVKISDPNAREISALRTEIASSSDPSKDLDPRAAEIIAHEEIIDRRTMRTWTTLCGYEEACAAEISGLVQSAVNGDFQSAYSTCSRLVAQIRILFTSLDLIPKNLNSQASPTIEESSKETGKEAKTLCRKIVSFMSLLSKTRDLPQSERIQGLAKDLLSLASAVAHYIKVLIRQSLAGALSANILDEYLVSIGQYSQAKPAKLVSPFSRAQCLTCGLAVEHNCYRQRGRNDRLWHARAQCFKCFRTNTPLDPSTATVDDQGRLILKTLAPDLPEVEFTKVSKLEQYVVLLHVALARLDLVFMNSKRSRSQEGSPSPLDSTSGTKTVSASTPALPNSFQKDDAATPSNQNSKGLANSAPTVLERTSMILHEKAGLTLDDIRRIVASQQAKVTAEYPRQDTSKQPSQAVAQQRPQNAPASRRPIRYFGTLNDDEYAWSRQIAQALLQPYARKYLKKDLDTVSMSSKTPTLWGRMGKVFNKEQENKIFGQPLEKIVAKYGVDSNLVAMDSSETGGIPKYTVRIPSFVDDCVTAMRQKDMSAEGVFRKNGNIRRLREFVDKIDRNPDENGLLVDESPIQLAALLKKFLRDLPDPLLCSKLAPLWTVLPRLDREKQLKLAQLLIAVLPKPNRGLLEVLANFLNWVSGFAHVDDEIGSKMDIQNLATVLGPTLVLSNEEAEAATTALNVGSSSADSTTSFKNVSEPIKFLITDSWLVAQIPEEVTRCLNQLKRTPARKLSFQEVQDLLNKG